MADLNCLSINKIEMYSKDLRECAVNMYVKYKSYRRVAKDLNISPSTICRWFNYGIDAKKRTSYKPHKMTDNVLEHIRLFIDKHPICIIKDIIQYLKDTINLEVIRQTISTALRKLNITKKKVTYKNIVPNKTKEHTFIKAIKEKLNECDDEIYSVDECHFAENILPDHGYSKKGKRIFIKRKNLNKWKSRSLLLAVSNKGRIRYHIYDGAVNKIRFNEYMNRIKIKKNSTIMLDNVPFHHS